MALLCYAAKFDCAPTPSTLAQSEERKGSNFAIWQPRLRRPEGIPSSFFEILECATMRAASLFRSAPDPSLDSRYPAAVEPREDSGAVGEK